MGRDGEEAFIRFTGVQKSFQIGSRGFIAVRDVTLRDHGDDPGQILIHRGQRAAVAGFSVPACPAQARA